VEARREHQPGFDVRASVRPVLIAATHLAAFGTGFFLAPKQPVDTEAKNTGFFQVDATKVLVTTVESLRSENRLLVFSYKGMAKVEADRTVFWIFGGRQELHVPAVVPYYLNLADLSLADVAYNDKAKLVTVKLSRLTLGDIAFQPENATTINGGVLTWSEGQIEALRKMNYVNARRSYGDTCNNPQIHRSLVPSTPDQLTT
jgi:hypothetical protein